MPVADTITIRTDPETVEKLDRLAKATERSRNFHASQALKAYLDEQSWQIAAIQEGLASLDAEGGIADADVAEHFRRRLAEAEMARKVD
jgi:predicted transcriptional regulator